MRTAMVLLISALTASQAVAADRWCQFPKNAEGWGVTPGGYVELDAGRLSLHPADGKSVECTRNPIGNGMEFSCPAYALGIPCAANACDIGVEFSDAKGAKFGDYELADINLSRPDLQRFSMMLVPDFDVSRQTFYLCPTEPGII